MSARARPFACPTLSGREPSAPFQPTRRLSSVSSHERSSAAVMLTTAENSSATRFRSIGTLIAKLGPRCAAVFVTPEQGNQLVQSRCADQRVDDAAQRRHFAEQCCDEVEVE